MAVKLIFIMCIVWLVAAVHIPILTEIRNGVCGMFDLYKFVYAFYSIILTGILPPVLMSIFGILTIRSLHQRHGAQKHARQRDRYLMRMLIAEVVVNIFTSIPYSANLIYGGLSYSVASKSAKRLEIESFISFVSQFLIYLISVAPFYLFISTSKPFRNEFIGIIVKGWGKYIRRRVRIVPLTNNNITP
jgi:hypothetical protein